MRWGRSNRNARHRNFKCVAAQIAGSSGSNVQMKQGRRGSIAQVDANHASDAERALAAMEGRNSSCCAAPWQYLLALWLQCKRQIPQGARGGEATLQGLDTADVPRLPCGIALALSAPGEA